MTSLLRVMTKTYASPSSESSLLALGRREAPGMALDDTFWATPRCFGDDLFPCEGPGEEMGDRTAVTVVTGLEASSSEESPPAKARSSASKSAMVRLDWLNYGVKIAVRGKKPASTQEKGKGMYDKIVKWVVTSLAREG